MLRHGLALALSSFLVTSVVTSPAAVAETAAPSQSAFAALETALWAATEAGGTTVDYEAYLDQFPEGRYAGRARAQLDVLKTAKKERWTDATAPKDRAETARREEARIDLDRSARREIQERLAVLGHGAGGVDGLFGPATRRAIKEWQSASGISATGYLDLGQIARLVAETDSQIVAWRQENRAVERARNAAAPKTAVSAAPVAEIEQEIVNAANPAARPALGSAAAIAFSVGPAPEEKSAAPLLMAPYTPTTAQRSIAAYEDHDDGCYK